MGFFYCLHEVDNWFILKIESIQILKICSFFCDSLFTFFEGVEIGVSEKQKSFRSHPPHLKQYKCLLVSDQY